VPDGVPEIEGVLELLAVFVRLADKEPVALSLGVDEALDVSVDDGVDVRLRLGVTLPVPDSDGVALNVCDID